MTGRRLVALAVIGSSPIASKMGNETADPEDATVVMNPQRKPAASTRHISANPISISNILS
jgi:hypothetical protein